MKKLKNTFFIYQFQCACGFDHGNKIWAVMMNKEGCRTNKVHGNVILECASRLVWGWGAAL